MTELAGPDVVRALGWTLIHSLWQDAGLTVLAMLVMGASRRPQLRYLAGVSALALMLAAQAVTFLVLLGSGAASPGLSAAGLAAAPLPVMTAGAPAWSLVQVMPLLVLGWLSGVALFSLRLAGGFVLLERRRGRCVPPAAHFLELCGEVQERLGLQRAVRFLECDWLDAPAVTGVFRPIVLLPVATLLGLSEDQLRAVIAHELAHIRRLDVLANLLQAMVEALLFYHPAVWWLGRRIRAERERCCDEIAVSLYGNRLEYARALSLMQDWRSAPSFAMAANRGPLAERILCVLGRESAAYRPQSIGLVAGMLFLMAALSVSQVMPGHVFFPYSMKAGAPPSALVPEPVMRAIAAPVAAMPVVEKAVAVSARPLHRHRVEADDLPGLADTMPDAAAPAVAPDAAPEPKPETETAQAAAAVGVASAPPQIVDGTPDGVGNPNQMVCTKPQRQSASRLLTPPRCLTNAQWLKVRRAAPRMTMTTLMGFRIAAEVHTSLDGE